MSRISSYTCIKMYLDKYTHVCLYSYKHADTQISATERKYLLGSDCTGRGTKYFVMDLHLCMNVYRVRCKRLSVSVCKYVHT